ncbi:DNA translocase FtsK [bacterium (Candidatus Blackallbacteria) CG17_big_fil_post_rev_8_21_14_2_50_48_46]|uniref:DNA translocase FtsK n=1 Tax=bacterium (Candidatus Blackallbacteria) CG17_big_fil_post_rev_8_21_14_2_50_48_46 TaxID=2014261 RepID=A0A2M7G7B5_9BACT|nr:MAG: cell division protein FtsK [bacterium (Candidatus Blackallbacteria) CG18_big_fil_WC_8_21_14_2_50_49_26]PIW17934.1 MAG: DNA translocase FtsK [bacterium (Candidatus Blackallbacteria) CG17_big_fil_post_rev_8_21_14_2_50_48_46]PIW45753.1 MAG: DNA translocase FtsK [bacterium (Candidatus Blackallbacteria) CG13_big_fil_rev_8_21_14_2_50_49_14]
MNELELIAKVTTAVLRRSIATEENRDEGVARFLLDRLTEKQVAQICVEILDDPTLAQNIKIRIPKTLISSDLAKEFKLPEDILTDHKTTYWRNAPCEQRAIVLANTNDDQGQSLRDLTSLGAAEIKQEVDLWCQVASEGLPLSEKQLMHWVKSLQGLQEGISCSLVQFASYLLRTRQQIENEGISLTEAMGWALPALHIPKDSGFFRSIPPLKLGHKAEWLKRFQQARQNRSCFLEKQNPKREILDEEELRNKFEQQKDQIPSDIHPAIIDFLDTEPGWSPASEVLAEFEWEGQGISTLFEIKRSKTDLPTLTLDYYSQTWPDVLTDDDVNYLLALKKRKSKEPLEQDREFYENHRQELAEKPSLKSQWDKFIYGAAIECQDFISGLLLAVARLYDQIENTEGQKTLSIRTQFDKSRSKWLSINSDAATYFATRYKGLTALMGASVQWDVHYLFSYPEFIEVESKKQAKKLSNYSASKKANEIKFIMTLEYQVGKSKRQSEVQLNWKFNPNAIACKLYGDLKRLSESKSTFLSPPVFLEAVSKKGDLQHISLTDTGTLQAQFRQERGTLVSAYDKTWDMGVIFSSHLKSLLAEGHLNSEQATEIKLAWQNFSNFYKEALVSWLTEGVHSEKIIEQMKSYDGLLRVLQKYASEDIAREKLWEPLLKIGNYQIAGYSMSILAPWHPFRLASLAIQTRQTTSLITKLLTESVKFSDTRLFFKERLQELEQPYYPEITVGNLGKGKEPKLLNMTDSFCDYSLMERPVLSPDGKWETNEDPTRASKKIKDVVQRYLELLPHERASLDLVLFNCDNDKLPQKVIKELSDLYSGTDVICQVMLRHRNSSKLTALYKNLIENTSQEDQSLISGEYTSDFMSRFRIGILQESPNIQIHQGKPADIVFLQDVISNKAKEEWVVSPQSNSGEIERPNILDHVPIRWSKRRPSQKGEQKATNYLVSPIQPQEGLTYIKSIECMVEQKKSDHNYALPVRQISLKDDEIDTILDEVHRIGEWVVNYDDLLDRRQLNNYDVEVIRYQQKRNDKRKLLISSSSPTQMLNVLIQRRLQDLGLQLEDSAQSRLVAQIVDDGKKVSGDLVLRAAKRGVFAKELMGIVLSLVLLQAEIGQKTPMGVFSLDDYASWFGQKEQRIADIMVLNPVRDNNAAQLNILISEAKYIDLVSLSTSQKSSQNQLRDTVLRLQNALDPTKKREDAEMWLAKICDMLLEGITHHPQGTDFSGELEFWRNGLMNRSIPILIRGYSHVFVFGSHESTVNSQQLIVSNVSNCIQEIFNRESVKKLVEAYAEKSYEKIQAIRQDLGDSITFETIRQPQNPQREKAASTITTVINNPTDPPATQEEKPEPVTQESGTISPDLSEPEECNGKEQELPWPPKYLKTWLNTNSLSQVNGDSESQLQEDIVSRLKTALYSYDLPVKILGSRLTPNAILVRLKGSDQLTVDAVDKKRSQLLTTHALNLLSVTAQPGEIIISIERPQRQVISMADSWLTRLNNPTASNMNMSLLVGVKEIDGELLYLNVGSAFSGLQQHAPHTLIAGATGSGKSVLLQNLILDIAMTNTPDLAHIYLIDPKGIDYMHLDDLPHIHQGIIYDRESATTVLEKLVEEMDSRYLLFREKKAASLDAYNQKVESNQRLPVVWLVHDEFADWMMVDEYKEAVTTSVSRLGVKARAAGIHLVFAAQRPDANVLPLQLRENLGNRLILRVESSGTSKIALGENGAEQLLGKGHLLARLANESNLIYAQVPFLSSEQIEELTQIIKKHYANQ